MDICQDPKCAENLGGKTFEMKECILKYCDAENQPCVGRIAEVGVNQLCFPQVTPGALQTTTWAPCPRGDMSRAALSTAQTGGLSAAARTAGVPLIGVALTLTSPTSSADQTTSTLTSALATGYVNLRDEEDLYHKKRSGGAEAPGLRFPRITGSSARGMAVAQPGALQGCGKAAGLEMSGFPATLRTHAFGRAEKKGGADTLWVRFFFPGAFHLFFIKSLPLFFTALCYLLLPDLECG